MDEAGVHQQPAPGRHRDGHSGSGVADLHSERPAAGGAGIGFRLERQVAGALRARDDVHAAGRLVCVGESHPGRDGPVWVQLQAVVDAVLVPRHFEVPVRPLGDEEGVLHRHVRADDVLDRGEELRGADDVVCPVLLNMRVPHDLPAGGSLRENDLAARARARLELAHSWSNR